MTVRQTRIIWLLIYLVLITYILCSTGHINVFRNVNVLQPHIQHDTETFNILFNTKNDTDTNILEKQETDIEEIYEIDSEEPLYIADIDDYEAFILASVICNEMGGGTYDYKFMVGNVILNRVDDPRFPDTIYGVLTQSGQYNHEDGYFWFNDWADESVINECYDCAYRLLNGERMIPSNVVWQAQFMQGEGLYLQIGNTYLCY